MNFIVEQLPKVISLLLLICKIIKTWIPKKVRQGKIINIEVINNFFIERDDSEEPKKCGRVYDGITTKNEPTGENLEKGRIIDYK